MRWPLLDSSFFAYDLPVSTACTSNRYGNRWQQNPSGFLATFNGNYNRIDGYTYDAAGNLLSDGTNHYTYDAENRLSSYSNTAGVTASYVYDALGQRVEKTSNAPNECSASGTVFYLRDLSGHVAVYTVGGVNQCHDEIFAGGRHLVTYDGRATFNHSDWLGTERLRIVSAYVSLPKYDELYTSYPFGDALTGNLAPPYGGVLHFTGQPHDLESNLEFFGARYYSSSMGRFLSPDWSAAPMGVPYADFGNPQSLNLYSYVKNNPLCDTDPTGHCDPGSPGCALQLVQAINNFANDVSGYVGSFFTGAAKEELSTVRDNLGLSPAPELNPSNDVERAGAALTQSGQTAAAVLLPFVTGGEGGPAEVPDAHFVVRGGQGEIPSSGTYSGAHGATIEDAASGVPHGTIRSSTAGDIRNSGGSVESAPEPAYPGGPTNERHVNIQGGQDTFSEPKPNPVPRSQRVPSAPKPPKKPSE